MKTIYSTTIVFSLFVMSACTVPDASKEADAFAKSTSALAKTVSKRFDAKIIAEAKQRKLNAIASSDIVYSLTPGCDKLLADISVDGVEDRTANATSCQVVYRLDEDRELTQAELAKHLIDLIGDYGTALGELANSKLPSEIEASSTLLLTNISKLIQASGSDSSNLDEFAPVISTGAGFVSTRAKARLLKQAVRQADAPIQASVSSVIAVLIEQGRDPLYPAISTMQDAEVEMRKARGKPSYGRKVQAFEETQKEFRTAYKSSPTVALDQIRKTHAALASRLEGPATVAELQALLDELQTLKGLL